MKPNMNKGGTTTCTMYVSPMCVYSISIRRMETSFCVAKNQPECRFSVRLVTGPRLGSVNKRSSKRSGVLKKGADAAAGATSAGGDGGLVTSGDRRSAVAPLKR